MVLGSTFTDYHDMPNDVLAAFQVYYHQFQEATAHVLANPTDAAALGRHGDDLDEFAQLVLQVRKIHIDTLILVCK
jgi:hypothetical protein